MSSTAYAVLDLPFTLAGATYPLVISRVRIYAGSVLLRDSPRAAIIGSVLTRAGAHTIGLNLAIEISETIWNDVSGYGDSKTITVTTAGTNLWTVSSDNANLTVSPTSGASGQTATLTWATHAGTTAPAQRSATVTFAANPAGATATLTTTQDGVIDRIKINGLYWRTMNVGATTPQGYGNYYTWYSTPAACASLGAGWRLPTRGEFIALYNSGSTWMKLGGVNGRWFGPNSASANSSTAIFFPAAGYRAGGSMLDVGTHGRYWSSTEHDNPDNAYHLYFYADVYPQHNSRKRYEWSVRCVQ